MADVVLHGPAWSAYTRSARLALIEKAVDYQLLEVDFSRNDMPRSHFARHPFGKVPVLEHGDFSIYETAAICRYIDVAFDGPALQPVAAQAVARMTQIIAMLDAYLSEPIRMGYVTERLIKPMLGMDTDHGRAAAARELIVSGFQALADVAAGGDYLVADRLSLADLHAVPLFDYLALSPEGGTIIDTQPVLRRWWNAMQTRPSVVASGPDLTVFEHK